MFDKKIGLLLLLGLNASITFAATENPFISALKNGHVIFTVGGYLPSQGEKQHINIQDLIGDTFTVSNRNDINALLGLGYYVDGNHWNKVQMSYGLNLFYLAPTSVTGDVIQENLFDNLSYQYSVRHFPIYAIAKTAINLKSERYALILDAGIGPDFLTVTDFQEKSLDGITIPEQPISANTKTTFSATIGAGIKFKNVSGNVSAECGYRFFYLGQGQFRVNNSQVLNNLDTGTIYANAIQCSISG